MISTDRFYKDHLACAKKVNYLFKRLNQLHYKICKRLEKMPHQIVSTEEVHEWSKGDSGNSPILEFKTAIHTWTNMEKEFINRGFEREIEYNLLDGNVGYSEFIENTFANQWAYIKHFDNSLKYYVNEHDSALEKIARLSNLPEKFNKDAFKECIELDIINVFYLTELMYLKYDKKYKPFFRDGQLLTKLITNSDYLALDYGDSNDVKVKDLYNKLEGYKFIGCTEEEFMAHFDPFCPIPPLIKWLKNDVALMTLFLGKTLFENKEDKSGTWYQLRLKKEVSISVLMKHFKFDESTDERSLSANYSNSFKRRTIMNAAYIKIIINNLDGKLDM